MIKNFSFGRDKAAGVKSDEQQAYSARFAAQRELLRIAVKDTLRDQGIPASWIGSDLVIPGTVESGPQIRLVVQEWHSELLRFLPALQKTILAHLNALDTALKAAEQGVSWQFAADCGCPDVHMPTGFDWSATSSLQALQKARQKVSAEYEEHNASPALSAKQKFDLPVSDMDRHSGADWDAIPSTFAATQPGFLATQPASFSAVNSDLKP